MIGLSRQILAVARGNCCAFWERDPSTDVLLIVAMKLGMFSYRSKNLFFLEVPKTGAEELKANPPFKLR